MKTYLEPEEVELLEKAATNLRDRLLIRLLFRLGCRISEALALTVKDVDLDRGMVTIQHLKSRIKVSCPQCGARLGKTHTFCPGCGHSVEKALFQEQEHRRIRTLPIDSDTLAMLKDYMPARRPDLQGWQAAHLRHQPPPRMAGGAGLSRKGWPPRTGESGDREGA